MKLLILSLSIFCISFTVFSQREPSQSLRVIDEDPAQTVPAIDSVKDTTVVVNLVHQDTMMVSPDAIYVKVEVSLLPMSKKKSVTSLASYIEASPDQVMNYMSDKMKKSYQVKMKRKKGMLLAKEASLMEINPRPLNMYMKIDQAGKQTLINTAFELNNHYFIGEGESGDLEKAKSFVHTLVKGYYVDYYNILLEEMQAQYDALIKQKDQLLGERKMINHKLVQYNNKRATNDKNIAKAEAIIEKSQSRISINKGIKEVNEQKLVEYDAEKAKINSNKGTTSEELDEALDKLKDIEKDIQKATKQIAKAEKNNAKDEATIVKAETSIETDKNENAHLVELSEQGEKELAQKDFEIERKDAQIQVKLKHLGSVKNKLANIY